MPDNFSFIDNTVAGSAQPYQLEDLQVYLKHDITEIISLTPNLPLVSKYYEEDEINFHHFPVFATPDEQQLQDFVIMLKKFIEKGKKAVIHCQYGQERTGIFLASYLIEMKDMNVEEAIQTIRNKRPGSLQTHHALRFLRQQFD